MIDFLDMTLTDAMKSSLYCIVFLHMYSAAHSSGHSVALRVREPRERKKALRRKKKKNGDTYDDRKGASIKC